MRETWVQFLDREVPLEKEMAAHSSILARRIPWTEEPGRLQFMGSQESDTTWSYIYSAKHRAVSRMYKTLLPAGFFSP